MVLRLARRRVRRSITTPGLRGLRILWTKISQRINKSKTRRAKIFRVELRLVLMLIRKI